jgi:putative ABC transport system permease protein
MEPLYNGLFAITDDDAGFAEMLFGNENVRAVINTEHQRRSAWEASEPLQIVVIVLIVLSAVLAFVVLFNLANINISERIRELATIKVLGFYDGELSMYIFRESGIITIMGIVLGLMLGVPMHRFVLIAVETDFLMFPRIITPLSYVYSAAFAVLFAVIVNLVMKIKISKIDMVMSLKGVE